MKSTELNSKDQSPKTVDSAVWNTESGNPFTIETAEGPSLVGSQRCW